MNLLNTHSFVCEAIKMQLMTTGSVSQAVHILSHVARPHSAQGKGIWDMAIEQFIAPHRGVCTNHSVWNANCDKNWFTLSTGSFPDLMDPGTIHGIKVQS